MTAPVVCLGASFVDELFYAADEILPATTTVAVASRTAGGVSRNIAHQLALLEVPVQLISVFGSDGDGDFLKEVCKSVGVALDASLTIEGSSGKYTAIINKDGSLYAGLLTNQVTHLITPGHLELHRDLLKRASLILADTNMSTESIEWLLAFSRREQIPFIIEPVSVPPARKLKGVDLSGLYLITPNEDELPALCSQEALTREEHVDELFRRGAQFIWLHNGKQGSEFYSQHGTIVLEATSVAVIDSTGAGDAAVAGFILGKYLGMEDVGCLKLAHTLASETLRVKGAVSQNLEKQKLLDLVSKYYPDK